MILMVMVLCMLSVFGSDDGKSDDKTQADSNTNTDSSSESFGEKDQSIFEEEINSVEEDEYADEIDNLGEKEIVDPKKNDAAIKCMTNLMKEFERLSLKEEKLTDADITILKEIRTKVFKCLAESCKTKKQIALKNELQKNVEELQQDMEALTLHKKNMENMEKKTEQEKTEQEKKRKKYEHQVTVELEAKIKITSDKLQKTASKLLLTFMPKEMKYHMARVLVIFSKNVYQTINNIWQASKETFQQAAENFTKVFYDKGKFVGFKNSAINFCQYTLSKFDHIFLGNFLEIWTTSPTNSDYAKIHEEIKYTENCTKRFVEKIIKNLEIQMKETTTEETTEETTKETTEEVLKKVQNQVTDSIKNFDVDKYSDELTEKVIAGFEEKFDKERTQFTKFTILAYLNKTQPETLPGTSQGETSQGEGEGEGEGLKGQIKSFGAKVTENPYSVFASKNQIETDHADYQKEMKNQVIPDDLLNLMKKQLQGYSEDQIQKFMKEYQDKISGTSLTDVAEQYNKFVTV